MEKPKPTREVAVIDTVPSVRLIMFNASAGAVDEFQEFGVIAQYSPTVYWLTVDARYNFGDVLAYIEHYGEDE